MNIQNFLKNKFSKLNIKREDFIQNSGISRAGISELINGITINPTLITVIKIANYFNCSIDEVLGRKKYLHIDNFKQISLEESSNNTKHYIITELKQRNITAKQLAHLCKVGNQTIHKFIIKHNPKKNLNIKILVAIANYCDVSIDYIIGRIN